MTAIILDTETTGFDEPQVIELSYTSALFEGPRPLRTPGRRTVRYRPSKPISLGAKAAHGITEQDLADYALWPGSWEPPPGIHYIIGHNIDYDWRALGSPDVQRICTYALARHTWPSIDSHTLGALMFHLFPAQRAKALIRRAHSASADVVMTWELLCQLLTAHFPNGYTWEQVHTLSETARVPTIMPFGKHKGRAIKEVPGDYKRWLLGQDDVDPYLAKALRQ